MKDRGGAIWDTLPPLDRRLAVMEALAHLEAMRRQGKVDKAVKDDIVYYHPN